MNVQIIAKIALIALKGGNCFETALVWELAFVIYFMCKMHIGDVLYSRDDGSHEYHEKLEY